MATQEPQVGLGRLQETYNSTNVRLIRLIRKIQLRQQSTSSDAVIFMREVRAMMTLYEYIKSDMESPRYKQLSPAAKEIVDRSYHEHTEGLIRAGDKMEKINAGLIDLKARVENAIGLYRQHEALGETLQRRLPGFSAAGPPPPGPQQPIIQQFER